MAAEQPVSGGVFDAEDREPLVRCGPAERLRHPAEAIDEVRGWVDRDPCSFAQTFGPLPPRHHRSKFGTAEQPRVDLALIDQNTKFAVRRCQLLQFGKQGDDVSRAGLPRSATST
jgi:hypothetical protein